MRLVVAVVHTKDADSCVASLNDAGFPCTRLDSFGGFLERENVTLLVGVEAAQVDRVVDLLRARAKGRHERLTPGSATPRDGEPAPPPLDVEIGGATVFVLTVDRFEKL